MSAKLGANANIYVNNGTYATPVWAALVIVRDVTRGDSMAEDDATTRASGGVKRSEPCQRELGLTFEILEKVANTQYLGLRTAYLNRNPVDLLVCSGDRTVAGERTVRADFKIFKFEASEPLAGLTKIALELKPCDSDNPVLDAITV